MVPAIAGTESHTFPYYVILGISLAFLPGFLTPKMRIKITNRVIVMIKKNVMKKVSKISRKL